jgi:alpha-mannosidase
MSLTGAAPLNSSGAPTSANHSGNQYSVMVRFPLTTRGDGNQAVIDDVSYGTPNHWVEQMPEPYWPAPIFQAMHDVAIMQSAGNTLGAIYQSTIPAWGVDSSGAFIGCVLRNTPYDYVGGHGANGQDTDIHTHHYALRVPSSIQDMTTGAQLQESLAFTTPLHARYAGASVGVGTMPTGKFPATFSLASASPASAIITAAKPGTLDPSSLVFRVYQPTNGALSVKVTLASSVTTQQGTTVRLVTALEDPIEGSGTLPIDDSSVTFNAARAITTIEVDKPSSSIRS